MGLVCVCTLGRVSVGGRLLASLPLSWSQGFAEGERLRSRTQGQTGLSAILACDSQRPRAALET